MMEWLLIIDGGATKTACAVVHAESGEIKYTKSTSGSNYQAIGAESATAILHALLAHVQDFLQKQECSNISVATFAMAGIDSPKDHEIVSAIVHSVISALQLKINTLIIENDAQATLLGVTAGQAGALLIAGTGAIAYAFDGSQIIVRAGGWGHRAGDEGSGYWLGQEVIRAIFRMEDGRGEPTLLKDAVYDYLRIQDVTELATWLFRPSYTNAQLAKMGAFLADAVTKKDSCAIQISMRAAQELVLLACAVLKKVGYQGEAFTLYCNGGAIKHNPLIFKTFSQEMKSMYPQIEVSLCQHQPIYYLIERTKRAYDNL
ncbi:BadF/BadG/BcrA/BcrD ATPase family protein [Lysinibacillus sp. fls2-241-R2A-57]|uniref:N-acetylglucosamine kinase n=1 Tax=Lysinibacillus sp. fls2-241-R2A-57 TaxID=3040292 RepID=UPI002552190F|nr:BadF/BadG/BcrA/BcrD ATPase family protein [Lysinibacillus sp. fls2-241-R2A-57]